VLLKQHCSITLATAPQQDKSGCKGSVEFEDKKLL
jgi:hypothetical protein